MTETGIIDQIMVSNSLETLVGRSFVVNFNQGKNFNATLTSPTGRMYSISGNSDKTAYPIEAAYGDTISGVWTLRYNKSRSEANYRFGGWSITNVANSPHNFALSPSIYTLSSLLNIQHTNSSITEKFELSLDFAHPNPLELKATLTSPAGKIIELFGFNSIRSLPKTLKMSEYPQLKELQNTSINGNWKLEITDREGNGTGLLNKWGIKDNWCGI